MALKTLRHTLVLLLIWTIACSSRPQKPTYMVFDLEHVLQVDQGVRLDSLYMAHERRTGNQIILVTTPSFHGMEPVDFAVAFGDSVGVGKKDRGNGVVIAFSRSGRGVFIATGRGTEKVLHDSICQRIIDRSMIPRFKKGDPFGGLWAGSLAVVEFLDRPENAIP